jgi:hypothetical protein
LSYQLIRKTGGSATILQFVAASKELLLPAQSDDLNAPQLTDIRTMRDIARRKENTHAHKTNLDAEKGDSDAKNKVGWQENSEKETESRR